MDIDKKALGQRIKDIRVKRKENMQQFADMIKNETDNASTQERVTFLVGNAGRIFLMT